MQTHEPLKQADLLLMSDTNEFLWTATRYSDTLKLDRRRVASALETAPSVQINGKRCWHIRDGMPAIFGSGKKKNPAEMEPGDELDHYKAQREKLRLGHEIQQLVVADDAKETIGAAFTALSQTLDGLPAQLAASCDLPEAAVDSVRQALSVAQTVLEQTLFSALEKTANDS